MAIKTRRLAPSLIVLLLILGPQTLLAKESDRDPLKRVRTDLLIVGGTESGWAAAIQAARGGVPSITIVHDGRWLGGQFTEQALACVDENKGVGKVGWGVDWHPMKRSFHRSGLFQELMQRIESHNRHKYGLAMPGRPFHGPSTFRPVEAESIFRDMLRPYIKSGQVRLVLNHFPVKADVLQSPPEAPQLTGLWFARLTEALKPSPRPVLHVQARLTIDASDWGDAIQVAGAAYECGPEPQAKYGEPSAPLDLTDNPRNEMNPITWAMIVEQSERETPIDRPESFDDRNFNRTTRLSLGAMQGLPWDRPVRLGSIQHWPAKGAKSPRQLSVYTVRRLVDGASSRTGKTLILLNYMLGQDYPLERLPQRVVDALEATEPGAADKNIVEMTRKQRRIVFEDAKRHALSVLYHLQHFVHERAADKAHSFLRFHLSDEFGTADRLPPKPYIRESLRLRAMYMMREQDGRNRDGPTKQFAQERFAHVMYPDGVFAWQFHYDFHRTGRAYLRGEGRSGPWVDFEKPGRHTSHVSDRSVFPLRSLVPIEMDGLLGAQKNVGYSSIVCAAIRLHDQCIAIGQAAGAAATVSLRENAPARALPMKRELLEQVRDELCRNEANQRVSDQNVKEGVSRKDVKGRHNSERRAPLLLWPFRDLPSDHAAFVGVNRLACLRLLPLEPHDVDFNPDRAAEPAWRKAVVQRTASLLADGRKPADLPQPKLSRAEFCRLWWERVSRRKWKPFVRLGSEDADGDGILDRDDPTPFTVGPPVAFSIDAPGAHEDGLPPSGASATARQFNFMGGGDAGHAFIADRGRMFTLDRGYGWRTDMQDNHRRRGRYPEPHRDTFLFTRASATWECLASNGPWRVTVCIGDAAHEQRGQNVTVENVTFARDVNTFAGRFFEISKTVSVKDGRLTVKLGPQKPGCNTCLNWIRIERL